MPTLEVQVRVAQAVQDSAVQGVLLWGIPVGQDSR
jgi:hypothetical protein